ncbi:MAG TPA: NADH-quinone oxidoreductase subunit NuoH [Pirellulales bacterium]|nr:NADH-quinone oxidoreductase subunit NuoH [Pirellulales bacterium]
MTTEFIVETLVKIALLLFGLMTAAAYLVLLERWMAAWVQDRLGPNRVGIPLTKIRLFGLGQPLADGLKFILKEEITPHQVDKVLYTVAPIVILATALATFAAIPFGSVLPADAGIPGVEHQIDLVVAPQLDVGLIYVFALSSIAVYGVLLGGWASNSKYSFLGGLRSSAQLIAYELPLGLGILGVVLFSGSLRLETIIGQQAASGVWNIFWQPIGFIVFLVAAFAESARLPFDLPEAEQELVGGYHTEYAGMRLLMYLIAEFLHMVAASFLIVMLYFGGWHFWGLTGSDNNVTWVTAILRIIVLLTKILAVILFFMLARWSWPRFRFDQLMNLSWKVMLPLGVVNLVAVAVVLEAGRQTIETPGRWLLIGLMWILGIVTCGVAGFLAPLQTDNRPKWPLDDAPFSGRPV